MEMTRKQFLGAATTAAAAALAVPEGEAQTAKKAGDPFHLGITLYSFNDEFYHYKYSFHDCMEKAGSLGPGTGLELVGPQMINSWPEVSLEFERTFKDLVQRYGLHPTSYGGYSDPERITGKSLTDAENTDYIKLQIRSAKKLGFPLIRGGRGDLASYAEKMGVKMAPEIHSPNVIESPQTQALLEEVQKINSPFYGVTPDCGIFANKCAKPYLDKFTQMGVPAPIRSRIVELWQQKTPVETITAEVEKMGGDEMALLMARESKIYFGLGDPKELRHIMPHVMHVHGKFFGMDAKTGTEPAVPYPEVIAILTEGGYKAYMSSEYEGHHWMPGGNALWQVKTHQAMIRKLFAKSATGA